MINLLAFAFGGLLPQLAAVEAFTCHDGLIRCAIQPDRTTFRWTMAHPKRKDHDRPRRATESFGLYDISSKVLSTDPLLCSSNPNGTAADILICGGGPVGLLTAIMMAQTFPARTIEVYDRQSAPASPADNAVWDDTGRHYLIGLGGRGLTSLESAGVDISPYAVVVPGRKDWTPEQPNGVETIRSERKYTTQVLPRDKLVSVLYEKIVNEYSEQVNVHFETEVRPVNLEFGENQVLVEVSAVKKEKWIPIVANMLLASDGSARTVANYVEEMEKGLSNDDRFRVVRYPDDNARVYKTLPFRIPGQQWLITSPSDTDIHWNYAVRSKDSRVIFDALPANDRGDYVGILLLREDDTMAQPSVGTRAFKNFLRQEIPQFFDLIPPATIASAAEMKASLLPQFRYVTPRMHHGNSTVLLGDCAHSVKPYFGMGCNTALEDVRIFLEYLSEIPDDCAGAIQKFSDYRTREMQILVETSRDLDRPGILGVVYFLIPIILDGIFSKLLPGVFQPNIISLIQNEEYSFHEAVQQKAADRLGQILFMAGTLYAVGFAGMSFANFVYSSNE